MASHADGVLQPISVWWWATWKGSKCTLPCPISPLQQPVLKIMYGQDNGLLCTPSHLWLSYKSVTTTCVSTTETSVHVPDVHCFLHQSARKSPWTSQQGFVLFKLVVIIMSLSSKACNAENTVFDCWQHCKLTFRQKMLLSLLLSAMFRHASSQTCLAQLHTWPITARCCSSSQMKGR